MFMAKSQSGNPMVRPGFLAKRPLGSAVNDFLAKRAPMNSKSSAVMPSSTPQVRSTIQRC
jgi:hypothetical protein